MGCRRARVTLRLELPESEKSASCILKATQRALRDRLMSRGKNCLPTVSRQFLTRNYPHPNCLLKCLPNCLSRTREGFLSSFKINPAVRVIARQVRDKNCLAAIFAPRHQSVSSGPLGSGGWWLLGLRGVRCLFLGGFRGGSFSPTSIPSLILSLIAIATFNGAVQ